MIPKKPHKDEDLSIFDLEDLLWACNCMLIFLCLIGLLLSLYAYAEEIEFNHNKNYKSFCDISENMSCTKVFNSRYGKGFGIFNEKSIFAQPNSFFGIVFYSLVATLSFFQSPLAVNGSLILIITSNFTCLYFAYILFFILQDLCIICISNYIVNVLNLVFIVKKYKAVELYKKEFGCITMYREKSNID